MKNKIILIAIFLINSSNNYLFASEERILIGKAPNGIEYLETHLNSHKGMPLNKGAHGSKEYCYKTNIYIVYSSNLLGHGYELSKKPPKNLKCKQTNKEIKGKNKLGMYIGMSKSEVENLLNLKNIENNQPLIWKTEIFIKDVRFDLQTYVELLFTEGKLEWISVFTTTTT